MKNSALAILAGLLLHVNPTVAQPRQWEPFTAKDYWITGTLSAAALASYTLLPNSSREWIAPSELDERARTALRLNSHEGRHAAAKWSDATLALTIAIPVGVDALGIAWQKNENWSSAAQILNIDIQSFALTGLLSATTKSLVGRERPYARACRLNPGEDRDCPSRDDEETYKSFFSGHSAFAFTAAGLTCLHHKELQLLGEPGDSAMCAAALVLATTTATLRISADKHYLSDVTTGALIGIASGIVFPKLMHSVQKNPEGANTSFFVPTASATSIGLSHVYFF